MGMEFVLPDSSYAVGRLSTQADGNSTFSAVVSGLSTCCELLGHRISCFARKVISPSKKEVYILAAMSSGGRS